MTTALRAALIGRWRRLDAALADARAAGNPPASDPSLQDAAAHALHEIYDLWEIWRADKDAASRSEEASSSDAAKTAAALAWARGKKTHEFVEWGQPRGFGEMPFGVGPFGGHDWRWGAYEGSDTRDQSQWFHQFVATQAVVPPLETAAAWLRTRPELCIPDDDSPPV